MHTNEKLIEKRRLTAFIDESGTILKGNVYHPDFFIIACIFTTNERMLNKVFKRERKKVLTEQQLECLTVKKEIKGSDMTEESKQQIYDALIQKCRDYIEIGIIVLDNKKTSERLRRVSSRTFDYILEKYLDEYYRHYSRFQGFQEIFLHIDERNVPTRSQDTLEEFLNTVINIDTPLCTDDIKVSYHDSRTYLMLQFADIVSNTFYRYFMRSTKESIESVEKLRPILCKNSPYFFPEKPLGFMRDPLTPNTSGSKIKLTI